MSGRPLAGPSPLSGPSPRAGPSPLAGPSPRPVTGPSPRNPGPSPRPAPSPAGRPRGLPTPTRPSPASLPGAASPNVPSKRRESSIATDKREPKRPKLPPGAQWITNQVDVMQKQYKDALIAATMILQYKADCQAIGYASKPPRRLEIRLEAAWKNYDATRRHVEWFIVSGARGALSDHQAQNVEYAAAPDKFNARLRPPAALAPPPIPTPSPASALPAHLTHTPNVSSPIPLSSTSFLSQNAHPPAVTAPAQPVQENVFPEGLMFPDGNIDLSNLGMDELNAIISGANGMDAQQQAAGTPGDVFAMTPNTSKLLATLEGNGTPAAQAAPTPSAGAQQATPAPDATPSQAPPAPTAPAGDSTFDFTFDPADMDLSNLDLEALEGLFGGGNGGGDDGGLAALGEVSGSGDGGAAGTDNAGTTAPADDAGGDLNLDALLAGGDLTAPPVPEPPAPVEQSSQPTAPVPAPEPVVSSLPDPVPAPQPAPDATATVTFDDTNLGDQGGMGDINFDDFNFDDQMPQVDGDEFASLFAEFK
ncbi:uncharacterized protein LOC62_02G002313 [Vanrija pseudolonga]|uniref:Uncharacterized protein n=1 Tax=Vanrija pseudolonga TaxID=143232 RepID=A0AAF0Y627_9TREE|nr:hypothetical protein LOC62_02G002313 [Vanrija pseudolonga]